MATNVMIGWLCENVTYVLSGLFSLVASTAILFYRVRVHHNVLFGDRGEINFVTKKEKDELLHDCKDRKCPVHEESIDLIKETRATQKNNIERLTRMDDEIKEGKASREKIHEMLITLNTQLATLVANSVHMSSDIRELKEQR